MIILSSTTDTVRVKLGTNPILEAVCYASFRDTNTSNVTAGRNVTLTDATTPVTLVTSPASATQRVVDYISIYNRDSSTITVTVELSDNGTLYTLCVIAIESDEKIEYQEGEGFRVLDRTGAVRVSDGFGSPALGSVDFVVKNSDQTTLLTTFTDINNLFFPVTAGKFYWFRFVIPYTSNSTANGSRYAIIGPASPAVLYYYMDVTATTSSKYVQRGITTYDGTVNSSSSAATNGNIGIVEGVILPSASGTVIARFASRLAAGNSITQKAGAFVKYIEL